MTDNTKITIVDMRNDTVASGYSIVADGAGNYHHELISGGGGSGSTTFLDLTDTPSVYTDKYGFSAVVNIAEDGVEFVNISGGAGGGVDNPILMDYVIATSTDTHTNDTTWEDIDSMTVTLNLPASGYVLVPQLTARWAPYANWVQCYMGFVLDSDAVINTYTSVKQATAFAGEQNTCSMQYVYGPLTSGSHTIKAQWYTNSNLDVHIYLRTMTVVAYPPENQE